MSHNVSPKRDCVSPAALGSTRNHVGLGIGARTQSPDYYIRHQYSLNKLASHMSICDVISHLLDSNNKLSLVHHLYTLIRSPRSHFSNQRDRHPSSSATLWEKTTLCTLLKLFKSFLLNYSRCHCILPTTFLANAILKHLTHTPSSSDHRQEIPTPPIYRSDCLQQRRVSNAVDITNPVHVSHLLPILCQFRQQFPGACRGKELHWAPSRKGCV